MLFSKLHDFISLLLVPLLPYSIMLLFSIYENMTTKHRSANHIKLLALLHCTKIYFLQTISNNHTKMCAIPICSNKYEYLIWHPPFLLRTLQMAWRKTLCGVCSLRNFTLFIIGTLTDASLWLQQKRKSCIKRTIVILNKAEHKPMPRASPCSVSHWRYTYSSPFKLNYASARLKLMAVPW
jgi:FlaA1/EpsC-like NDP-sugar epimerase